MNKEIEIPFGAKDSELKGWEYTIPENMEAEIKDGKIIVREKESDDAKIRKDLITFICQFAPEHLKVQYVSYLEKQKEQRSEINIEHLKSYMLQYLQDASNREDDSKIEADTDKWARMIIKVFGGIKQKPAEWSEEDKVMLNNIIWSVHMKSIIKPLDEMDDRSRYKKYEDFLKSLPERFNLQPRTEWSEEDESAFGDLIWCIEQARKSAKDENDMWNIWYAENWLKKRLKSLRPQPNWKPSEEQMEALKDAFRKDGENEYRKVINSLYCDLQKLL